MTILMRLVSVILVIQLAVGGVNSKQPFHLEKCLAPLSSLTANAPPLLPMVISDKNSSQLLTWLLMPLLFIMTSGLFTGCNYLDELDELKERAESKLKKKHSYSIAELTALIHQEIKRIGPAPDNRRRLLELIDQRNEQLKSTPMSKEDLSVELSLSGIAQEIYFKYDIIIEGTTKKNELVIKNFLNNTPIYHLNQFHSVIGRCISFNERTVAPLLPETNSGAIFFDRNSVEKSLGNTPMDILSHEMGHNVHRVSQMISPGDDQSLMELHRQSVVQNNDFFTEYSRTNYFEEIAEIYGYWRTHSQSVIQIMSIRNSPRLNEKIEIIVRKFLIEKNGQFFLRVFRNQIFEDIPVTLPYNDPNHLSAQQLIDLYLSNPSLLTRSDNLLPRDEELIAEKIADKTIELPAASSSYLYAALSRLKETGRSDEAIETILLLLGSYREEAHAALELIQTLTRISPYFESQFPFDATVVEKLKSLDELEAYYILDPVGVENWLANDLDGPMKKIIEIAPYFKNDVTPDSAFVMMALLYDKYLNKEAPDTAIRDQLLELYNNRMANSYEQYGKTIRHQKELVFLFLHNWDPTFDYAEPTNPDLQSHIYQLFFKKDGAFYLGKLRFGVFEDLNIPLPEDAEVQDLDDLYGSTAESSALMIIPSNSPENRLQRIQKYLEQSRDDCGSCIIPSNSNSSSEKPTPPSSSSDTEQGDDVGLLRDENEVEVSL